MANQEKSTRQTQTERPGLGVLQEELEEGTGEREAWASLLTLLPP